MQVIFPKNNLYKSSPSLFVETKIAVSTLFFYPLTTRRKPATTNNDAMNVWMKTKVLTIGMQNADDTGMPPKYFSSFPNFLSV